MRLVVKRQNSKFFINSQLQFFPHLAYSLLMNKRYKSTVNKNRSQIMKKVSYGAALIVMAGGALCLLAHDTDEKIPAPGFRPECEQAAAFLKSVGTCQIAVLPTV